MNWYRKQVQIDFGRRKAIAAYSKSQAGQDVWVYTEVFNEKTGGYFVDAGAHDGYDLSNTFLLEKRYHWKGICIEGNPHTFKQLEKTRDCICINQCVDSIAGTVEFVQDGVMGGILSDDCDNQGNPEGTIQMQAESLANILDQAGAPTTIDYLSMDIEGAEDRALLGFPFDRYSFNCITIERPSAELRALLKKHKYLLIKEIHELDCFYIHESFAKEYNENLIRFSQKDFVLVDDEHCSQLPFLYPSKLAYLLTRMYKLLTGK